MRVRALVHCDAMGAGLRGEKLALFAGQNYDLPDAEAKRLIALGKVESVRAKMVDGPLRDKMKRTRQTK